MKRIPYISGDYSNMSKEERQCYIDLIILATNHSSSSYQREDRIKLHTFFFDMITHIKNKLKQVYNDTHVLISIDDFIENAVVIDNIDNIESICFFDNTCSISTFDGDIANIYNISNVIDENKVNNYIKEYLASVVFDAQNELNNIDKHIEYLKHKRDTINCYLETNYKD